MEEKGNGKESCSLHWVESNRKIPLGEASPLWGSETASPWSPHILDRGCVPAFLMNHGGRCVREQWHVLDKQNYNIYVKPTIGMVS